MEVLVGQKYRHHKGKEYIILAIAHHSETGEKMVVYQGQYDDEDLGPQPIFVRPYDMFCEHVVVDGEETLRFTPIS